MPSALTIFYDAMAAIGMATVAIVLLSLGVVFSEFINIKFKG